MRFSEVIGLQEVKGRLLDSVKEGRISHAQLFSGQKGCHGLAMALAYASYLMCEDKSDTDSCGKCGSCIKNDKLVHPDLHFSFPVVNVKEGSDKVLSVNFLDKWRSAILQNPHLALEEWYEILGASGKQGLISAAETEHIIQKLSLKSFESPYKILVMWMPEKMMPTPANKLLKTLEEPTPGTVILFVTENSFDLLPTIRSRMQLVRIPQPSTIDLAQFLMNSYGLSHERAMFIIKIVAGNVASAISLANLSSDEEAFAMETEFIHWMRLCYMPFHAKNGNYAWNDLNEWIDETNKRGKEYIKRFLSFCSDAARECMLLSVGAADLVRLDDSVIPGFSKFSRFIHSGNIEPFMEIMGKGVYGIERNANPRILLLDLSFKINTLLNPKTS
jgi:DNA polymerase-3 subunit delta'